MVMMMSVIYAKYRRDKFDDIMTPDDCPMDGLMTPNSGRNYTPREGSLVMVVSVEITPSYLIIDYFFNAYFILSHALLR
ncbi:hypothetical protein BBJ29_007394 [Phytophthora kernoviae]|uniref:Uncharacterized protein n=1 Tax=Phytophthora kernoviae TaxID=325452 RepID=A0A3F2S0H7_9STRA|nr:hypothetical protein BBJ29_007394 [Phytophthora kernoviae]RLN67916.1 hypothetical protein BBP00_00001305 [Phytophthora kernoviae]